jgi:hypothetical protein
MVRLKPRGPNLEHEFENFDLLYEALSEIKERFAEAGGGQLGAITGHWSCSNNRTFPENYGGWLHSVAPNI